MNLLRNNQLSKCCFLLLLFFAHSSLAATISINPLFSSTINEGQTTYFNLVAQSSPGYHLTGLYEGGGSFNISSGEGNNAVRTYSFPSSAPKSWTSSLIMFLYENDGVFSVNASGTLSQHLDSNHSGAQRISVSDSLLLTVLNVAPVITGITQDLTVKVNEAFNFSASAYDPGVFDTLRFEWDLDDDGLFDNATGQNGSHSFSKAGIYNIGLRVSDDDTSVFGNFTVTTTPVSAPASFAFLGIGLITIMVRLRSKS